jgi:hypothetical protein
MGEHYAGSVGVVGSNPIGSTTSCFGILTFGKRCIDCRFHFLYDFDIVNLRIRCVQAEAFRASHPRDVHSDCLRVPRHS